MNIVNISDDFYIYINTSTLPRGTTPFDFAVRLAEPLKVDTTWKVGVSRFVYFNPFPPEENSVIYIESPIAAPSIVNSVIRNVLCSVPTVGERDKQIRFEPENITYTHVQTNGNLKEIRCYIRNDAGDLLPELAKHLWITLHFKRY